MNPRVLHLAVSLDHGGLERLVVDWTNTRNRRSVGSTSICCLDMPGALSSEVEGGSVVSLGAQRSRFPCDLAAVGRLRRLLRGVDCVHTHNMAAWQYAVAGTVGLPVRHVHTEHGSNPHLEGLINRLRLRGLMAATAVTVAVSEATAAALAAAASRRAASQLKVIPNGVSPHQPLGAEARKALRAELGIGSDEWVIGSVGRLAGIKGYDRLIPAFAELSAGWRGRSLRLLLVGDGPERQALEALTHRLGIAAQVSFTGYRADSRRLLDVMDLFVVPSRSEGLSVALLEAMAAGLPVFVTDAGEHWQVVAQGAGAQLPEAVSAWSGILAGALAPTNAAEMQAMGACARRRVEERYGIERTLEAYERCYKGGE